MGGVEPTLKELQSIKKLLVLLAIKSGANSEEIGRALDVDPSTVRKMFPMKKTKKTGGE
jgi:NADH/NAD ratio-sensing transcriptional regulator Rex